MNHKFSIPKLWFRDVTVQHCGSQRLNALWNPILYILILGTDDCKETHVWTGLERAGHICRASKCLYDSFIYWLISLLTGCWITSCNVACIDWKWMIAYWSNLNAYSSDSSIISWVDFIFQFPPLCRRIKVQLKDRWNQPCNSPYAIFFVTAFHTSLSCCKEESNHCVIRTCIDTIKGHFIDGNVSHW